MNKGKQLQNKIIQYIVLVLIVICFTYLLITQILYPIKYYEYIAYASNKYDISPALILAIIKQESGFKENAISIKEARGLMQIIDSTAQEMAQGLENIDPQEYNIYDSFTNICLGTKYMRTLLNRYNNNMYLAICAYNARTW